MPSYSDEQIAALMSMDDLGGMEKKMTRQGALANTLRGQALQPSAHKDWASQLARGLQGGMAGYAMKQEQPMLDEYSAMKKKNLGTALGILGRGAPVDPNAAQTGLEDPPLL